MQEHRFQVGDQVFMASVIMDAQRKPQDVTVWEGTIFDVVGENRYRVQFVTNEGLQDLDVTGGQLYTDFETAEKRKFAAIAWLERCNLQNATDEHTDFLPEQIAAPGKVYFTDNPLRFGERKMAFAAYTNTWGAENSKQKQLQMVNAIWEDIRSLSDILFVLGFANDYTKKLVGKYVIIEINSLFICLTNLSKLDRNYESTLYQELLQNIRHLEQMFQFKAIRDKVAAHRDTNLSLLDTISLWRNITRYNISKYIDVFADHLTALSRQYPGDLTLGLRQSPVGVVDIESPPDNSYQPFDEPFEPTNSLTRA